MKRLKWQKKFQHQNKMENVVTINAITENIRYIKAAEEPLSSDVVLVETKDSFFVYDVGSRIEIISILALLEKPVNIVLSHFHQDHIQALKSLLRDGSLEAVLCKKHFGNFDGSGDLQGKDGKMTCGRVVSEGTDCDKYSGTIQTAYGGLYQGKHTYKYTGCGVIVEKPLTFDDSVLCVKIYPVPSSHAKGSLALGVGEYIFLGDAVYPSYKNGESVYNAQLLKALTDFLKDSDYKYCGISHGKDFIYKKEVVISSLEKIYAERDKKESIIKLSSAYGWDVKE